ncbi:GIY-YIG nuclease family protein [Methanobrevibacter sp.]|uniref:GIY-YIG nuclease family protein n=1 Tax=Methanobrevibacter sp. TaxID=66852 RepID=UPI00386626A7
MSRSGIYKITNERTGESYIGQSKNVQKRWNQHKNELNKGTHHNAGLQRDYNRGDRFNFQVLEYTPYLDERERLYISHFNTFHNGYNQTRGGSGTKYSPEYYNPMPSKEVKAVQNFIIASLVFIGLYLLTLYVSSLIFRPLGEYGNMVISTIVALCVSSYVILRWKTSFKLDMTKFFAKQPNSAETNEKNNTSPNNKVISDYINSSNRNTNTGYGNKPYIFVETVSECKSRIQNMNSKYFEQLINYFPTPRYQLRSDQIIFLFKNFSAEKIIKKVNELIVDEIYDNLSLTNKKEPEAILRQRISKICAMDKETFKSLCDDFSVPKYYKKEGQVQFLLNNYPYNQINEKPAESSVGPTEEDSLMEKIKFNMP